MSLNTVQFMCKFLICLKCMKERIDLVQLGTGGSGAVELELDTLAQYDGEGRARWEVANIFFNASQIFSPDG